MPVLCYVLNYAQKWREGEGERITQIIKDFGGDFIPLNQSPI
jgi:hypothetical protein